MIPPIGEIISFFQGAIAGVAILYFQGKYRVIKYFGVVIVASVVGAIIKRLFR